MDKNDLIGKVNKFKVSRETNIGYILVKDGIEYFLHKNESEKRFLKNGEEVDAFLYFDNSKRLAATLKMPIIQDGEFNLLNVVANNYPLGVFLDNNISKDLLLSGNNLPQNKLLWPIAGDKVFVRLKSYSTQLKALVKKEDFKRPENLKIGDIFKGYITLYANDSIYVVNDNLEYIKINKGNYIKKERVGKIVEAKIVYIGFQDILGDLCDNKDEFKKYKKVDVYRFICKNKEKDINYFKKEIIEKELGISHKLFKKLIIDLRYEKKIDIKNKKIIILKGENNG